MYLCIGITQQLFNVLCWQLEKAEEQEKLLEESKLKLEKRRQKEDEMRKQLLKTEVRRLQ